jgi:hypothetical protein
MPDPYPGAAVCIAPVRAVSPHTDSHVNERLSIFRK